MTRDEAIKQFKFLYQDGFCEDDIISLINKIFDGIENRSCDGCKWEDYDMPCLECTRCYQDKFEPKK